MTPLARFLVAAAMLGSLAQLWVHVDWIDGLSDHCDYPDGCLDSWLPHAFGWAERLWMATVLASALALLVGALTGARRRWLARSGIGWVASFAAWFFTPMVQPTAAGRVDISQLGEVPSLENPPYIVAVGLLMFAAAVFGWQAVSRDLSTRVPGGRHRAATEGAEARLTVGLDRRR